MTCREGSENCADAAKTIRQARIRLFRIGGGSSFEFEAMRLAEKALYRASAGWDRIDDPRVKAEAKV